LSADDYVGPISKIILDKSDYKPRKISLTEQEYNKSNKLDYSKFNPQEIKKYSLTNSSKYDKYDPYYSKNTTDNPTITQSDNRKSSYNKFDNLSVSNNNVKRNKAYSIYYHYDKTQSFANHKTKQTPLNKNFQSFSNFSFI
jgi:hypothetical protein